MTYRRILCATDFSAPSGKALERAIALAKHSGATLSVVHVVEHFPEDLPAALGAREDEDPQHYLVSSAQEKLAAILERLGVPEARPHVIVSRRSARHEIVEAVKREGADLLVVGGSERALLPHLGSTASGLLHQAPCDLLVVKSG